MHVKTFTNSPTWIVSIFALPLLGLSLFALQTAVKGRSRSARVEQAGGSVLLSRYIMEYGYWWLNTPANLLIRMGISPNAITLGGFAVVLVGVVLAAFGYFGLAGPVLLVGSLSDMLDGIVARRQQMCSDAGEFVDAMVDRYADIAVFLGLAVYYGDRPWALTVVLLALLGSIMVSYTRAKAESLHVNDVPGGPMRRAERAVYLGFGIMLSPMVARASEAPSDRPMYFLALAVCALIAVMANLSAVQMTLFVLRRLKKP